VQFQKKNWLEEAVACCQEAIRLRPDSPQTFYHQGNLMQALGRADEAAASFMQAARLDPSLETAHYNIAAYYKLKGELENASACYRRVLELQPNNPTARFLLAATSGKDQPGSAPAQYLTELFDDYAERFDDHLVKELGYRGPQSLRAAIPDQPVGQTLDILDLGCGTGLCGAAFRDLARTLTGIDLSPQMLARAEARGIYNRLIQGSVPDALNHASAAFDLILAGDLLIYIGHLAPLFPAIRKALRPAGRFVFQVEAYEHPGFALRPSVRFAHSATYVRELAHASGLTEVSMRQEVVRTENHQEIAGYIFVLAVPE
jgi:predicted TPR repeat methyltransferase